MQKQKKGKERNIRDIHVQDFQNKIPGNRTTK